jgi:hypothetical protein
MKKKPVRKVITSEEQAEIQLKNSLDDLLRIPYKVEPTYIFKVGEAVRYGSWDSCVVLEVFECGQYYKCRQETARVEYGRYVGQEIKVVYHGWLELLPLLDTTSKLPSFTEDDDIKITYYQSTVDSLIFKLHRSSAGVDMDPPYQRGLVWSLAQKEDLIHSIMRNIEIGKFTFIRHEFTEELKYYYEILDGKQRLNALCEFREGRFAYKGRHLWELSFRDQNHFTGYSASIGEVGGMTLEQKLRYFLKLNVAGVPQDPEHMKKIQIMWEKEKKGGL